MTPSLYQRPGNGCRPAMPANRYLLRYVWSKTMYDGTWPMPVASPSYIAWVASTYGLASFMYRLPAALTIIEPGRFRSARKNHARPGSSMVGPHQASSSRSVSAPTAIPASRPPPVLDGAPVDQVEEVGAGRNFSRSSWLCSNPPDARITPRLARMVRDSPCFS